MNSRFKFFTTCSDTGCVIPSRTTEGRGSSHRLWDDWFCARKLNSMVWCLSCSGVPLSLGRSRETGRPDEGWMRQRSLKKPLSTLEEKSVTDPKSPDLKSTDHHRPLLVQNDEDWGWNCCWELLYTQLDEGSEGFCKWDITVCLTLWLYFFYFCHWQALLSSHCWTLWFLNVFSDTILHRTAAAAYQTLELI